MYSSISAPPPTPSAQPNAHLAASSTTDAAADVLSRLLHRLPPTLSLPTRFSSPVTCPPPPPLHRVSLSDQPPTLSSFAQLGAFQLTDHGVPSQLACSAESDSLVLFKLTKEEKKKYFPNNWPLGYHAGDDEEAGEEMGTESFCLDSACSTESKELSLGSLREFTRALEEVGLKIVELLANAAGFKNPIGKDPTRFSSLLWVNEGLHSDEEPVIPSGFYPYVVGLQYQVRERKYCLLADTGRATVAPQVDSVLVTIGDIFQVWSNGKVKKVRGRAIPYLGDKLDEGESHYVSMTLLVTLPMEAMVSPLIMEAGVDNKNGDNQNKENKNDQEEEDEEEICGSLLNEGAKLFKSFSFEDYAWRAFHERHILEDPLDRYRL